MNKGAQTPAHLFCNDYCITLPINKLLSHLGTLKLHVSHLFVILVQNFLNDHYHQSNLKINNLETLMPAIGFEKSAHDFFVDLFTNSVLLIFKFCNEISLKQIYQSTQSEAVVTLYLAHLVTHSRWSAVNSSSPLIFMLLKSVNAVRSQSVHPSEWARCCMSRTWSRGTHLAGHQNQSALALVQIIILFTVARCLRLSCSWLNNKISFGERISLFLVNSLAHMRQADLAPSTINFLYTHTGKRGEHAS